ncbi:hypothetical protein [Aeromonas salmonicida]|uniref:hypothetical protein n=1 Tax=Aeromonas salmonicida TaxID=645 RepID=UPI00223ECBB7|nr:hypothetical protein [Aeromonas salmonicida]MDM5152221.1 hypothetical protein [Aeromonas salmonicida]HDX8380757.1 hypothetical protein [Aeromonas salmonicida]
MSKNGFLLRLEMSSQAGLVVSAGDRMLISSFWFSESAQAMGGVTCRGLSLFLFFSQRDKKNEKGGLHWDKEPPWPAGRDFTFSRCHAPVDAG